MFGEQNRLLLQAVGQTSRLLDVGCGIGNFLVDAIDAPSVARVFGLEVSIENARIAQSVTCGEVPIVLAPTECLPFRDESFDGVVARGVLHHLSDPDTAIRELHRILKPGGRLVVLEGNPASWYRRAVLGLADVCRVPHEDTQYRHLNPREIAQFLGRFGRSRALPVSGLFAPLAYAGLGGPRSWSLLDRVTRGLVRAWPSGFDWWLLWIADK
jgi:ubiquinone/menaquinone biosynthesis C-methylase UbiE